MTKTLSEDLLKILACPLCKGDLFYDKEQQELICEESKLAYKIINGVPNFLIEEARKLD